jgi:capsular polysaccharide biosynthesis protein
MLRFLKTHVRDPFAKILQKGPWPSTLLGPPKGSHPNTPSLLQSPLGPKWGAHFYEVEAAESVSQPASAISLSARSVPSFHQKHEYLSPSWWVAKIPRARVLGKSIAVVTPDDHVLDDVSLEWGHHPGGQRIFRRLRLPRAKKLQTPALLLASTGSENYFHWLFDVLPRLEIIRRSPLRSSLTRDWIVTRPLRPFQSESLVAYGFAIPNLLLLDQQPHLSCPELTLPSLPGLSGDPAWRTCQFLRTLLTPSFLAVPSLLGERIYLSRQDATGRRLKNESDLWERLEPLGFQRIFAGQLTFAQQATIFSQAKIIIGIHGAALTNLVFASERTKIIELFPEDYTNSCYRVIALHGRLRYFYALGSSRENSQSKTVSKDLILSQDTIERIVAEASLF